MQTSVDTRWIAECTICCLWYKHFCKLMITCVIATWLDIYHQLRNNVKLGHIQLISRNTKTNLHNSTHKDGVIQHSELIKKPSYQYQILNNDERFWHLICIIMSGWVLNSFWHFYFFHLRNPLMNNKILIST